MQGRTKDEAAYNRVLANYHSYLVTFLSMFVFNESLRKFSMLYVVTDSTISRNGVICIFTTVMRNLLTRIVSLQELP